ncbi:hypothetical protein NFI96_011567 [Prochilodus magdalenae]|nr:hypothetical protein NFI96_011567 [Prochilodus magdalenae]
MVPTLQASSFQHLQHHNVPKEAPSTRLADCNFRRVHFCRLILNLKSFYWFTVSENVISCDGHVQRLQCDSGLIRVKSAIYGRTDGSTCSTQRPSSELQNTNCALKIPLISKRCDGYKVCEFKTDVIGSPDPCAGTYKYYNTTYDCTQGYSSVACEYGYSTLDCGDKVIQIINANYGRTDSTTCSEGQSSAVTKNTNCYAPDTLTTVVTWCNGRSKCTVQALYTIFTDPCVDTYKYLHASYSCLPRPTETGILTIVKANYGRTDSVTCSAGRPSTSIAKTDCYGTKTLAEVMKSCEGETNCTVPATNSVFSDPCFGTYKYLSIVYSCVF